MSAARELLVLRHAKSSWTDSDGSDHARSLNDRGLQDAPAMGRWLQAQGLRPDHLLSSGARRARQTLALVAAELAPAPLSLHIDERIYEASTGTLLAVLADCPGQRVLLVGHNPGVEELVDYLLPSATGAMGTAHLVQIAMPADWRRLERGCGRLIQRQDPKSL